jgi:DNA-binding NarL/FixJ family response regulator
MFLRVRLFQPLANMTMHTRAHVERRSEVKRLGHEVDHQIDLFKQTSGSFSFHVELSKPDQQVLQLVAHGRTNIEIAADLTMSRAMVNRRVGNLITRVAVRLDDEQADRRTLTAVYWWSQRREGNALAPNEFVGLSEMGRLLYPLVAIGWSNQRITDFLCACGLCLSEETIDSHVDSIRVWVEIRTGHRASRARAIAYFWGGQWQPLSRAA